MQKGDLVEALGRHDGPIIVDLDETLYLRNSTQEFMNLAAPAILAALILRILQFAKPWRLTGYDTADCWRVMAIALLFPWTFARWRRHVARTAATFRNDPLHDAISDRKADMLIATLGFRPVVEPLIAALGYAGVPVIACRLGSVADRRQGKLAMLDARIGRPEVECALVITDSEQDRPLLDVCAVPILHIWPNAQYRRALARPYLPFDYASLIKRPGKGATKAIFIEDFTTWLIAAGAFVYADWRDAVALLLLFVSFWSIYELGYAENDRVAFEREPDPVLSATFDPAVLNGLELRGWLFGGVFGFAACLLLAWDGPHGLAWHVVHWSALLVGLRLTYALYNHLDKQSRVWLYALLQIFRAMAFAAVLPLHIIGAAFCAALALSRWISYFHYRLAKAADVSAAWPAIPQRFLRFWLLVTFIPIIAATRPGTSPAIWTAALVGFLCYAVLARHQIVGIVRNARFLRRPAPDMTPVVEPAS